MIRLAIILSFIKQRINIREVYTLRIMCLFLTICILCSCTSLGNLDPQTDSILIIPTEYIGEEGIKRFGYGLFTISQYGKRVKTISIYAGTKNKIISNLKEGFYVIDSYRFKYTNSNQSGSSYELNLPIRLKTGYVSIAPFVFTINIFKKEEDSRTSWFGINLEELTVEKRTEVVKNFYNDYGTGDWKILE